MGLNKIAQDLAWSGSSLDPDPAGSESDLIRILLGPDPQPWLMVGGAGGGSLYLHK